MIVAGEVCGAVAGRAGHTRGRRMGGQREEHLTLKHNRGEEVEERRGAAAGTETAVLRV